SKKRCSSLWQKYCEVTSSCVQMICAPCAAAFSTRTRFFWRLALGSGPQACWRRPRVTVDMICRRNGENAARRTCRSVNDLVERIFHDAFGTEGLELRDDFANDLLVDDGFEGDPVGVAEGGDGRVAQGGQRGNDLVERG